MGNWKPASEPFIVAVPIEGIESVGELGAGPVRITTHTDIGRQFGGFDHPGVRSEFDRTGVLGVTSVTARTMHEAEQRGIWLIQRAIDLIALAARFLARPLAVRRAPSLPPQPLA